MSENRTWGGLTEPVDRGPSGTHAEATGVELRVVEGPDAGVRVRLDAERLCVGTAAGNGLVLTDPSVSRYHCELDRESRGLRLRDLESTNGTFLDGVRVVEVFPGPGARLRLGRTQILLEEQGSVRLPLSAKKQLGELKGESVAMRRIFELLEILAATDASVLLLGESGTGKELAARALHSEGPRRDGPFQVVDCSAIPPGLIESELFGHEKGAFTGATDSRIGAFKAADGGTLFLDEIGELSLDLQPKLLRVLEAREVRAVGAARAVPVDVRLVSATNRDLRREVNHKGFRSDLYYRIATVTLELPPLRERMEDLPLLVDHFLAELRERYPAAPPLFVSPERLAEMKRYRWPGNLRELRNHLERAVALTVDGAVDASVPAGPLADDPDVDLRQPFGEAKAVLVARFERSYLSALLERTKGNVSRASREARIDRAHLIGLLRKHGIR